MINDNFEIFDDVQGEYPLNPKKKKLGFEIEAEVRNLP
jgi:hypothetical protein